MFIKTNLGDALPHSFVLESYCQRGVWAERGPPALIEFYSSASNVSRCNHRGRAATRDHRVGGADDRYKEEAHHSEYKEGLDSGHSRGGATRSFRGRENGHDNLTKVQNLSKNKFRIDLLVTRTMSNKCSSLLSGGSADQFNCVKVIVTFDNLPLPKNEVYVIHGGHEAVTKKGETIVTDGSGIAYTLVPKADSRAYFKTHHSIDTSGSLNGESYESIHHIASAVIELTHDFEVYPPEKNLKMPSSGKWFNKPNDSVSFYIVYHYILFNLSFSKTCEY